MPKRIAIVSLLLLAAVAAALLWSDRFAARAPGRSAPVGEGAALPESSPSADRPAAPDAQAAARLFGRVLEEGTDIPVSGASVTAYAFATGRTLRTTSAEDGTFDLPDAPAAGQAFQVVVRHDGFGAASLRCAASADPIVARLPKGGALRGRVVSEIRTPVSPCRVSAVRCRAEGDWNLHDALHQQLLPVDLVIEAAAATHTDGSFEVTGLKPGMYALLVDAEGFAPRSLGDWNTKERVEIRPGTVAQVEVVLPRTEAFLIDVLDEETGKALDAIRFEAVLRVERWSMLVPIQATRRDDGYELRAGFGKHRFESTWLRVSREGYAPRILTFAGQRAGHRFVVSLGRGATIAGHVSASGEPVRGALVLVEWEMGGTVVAPAITGPDGAFEIGALDAGVELAVRAYDRALEPIAVVTVILENGERRALEIGGPGATAIEGRIAVNGAPVANALVFVSGAGESATGRDGTFRIEGLSAGRHEVFINADVVYVTRFIDATEGQRLRLDIDASAAISGVVVDARTGEPVTDVDFEVSARRADLASKDFASADVGKDGRFRFPVEPGVYELGPDAGEIYAVERPRVDVTAGAEAEPVVLRVERDPLDGKIVLDVKDALTGETVPEGDYEHECNIATGSGGFEDGRVEEEGCPLGLHRFRVWSDAHAPRRLEVTITLGQRAVRQTITLMPSEAVRVVETARGGPAAVAGLRADDVILKCNEAPAVSIAALRAVLGAARGAVSIEFERAGERTVVTVDLGEMHGDPDDLGAEIENTLLGR